MFPPTGESVRATGTWAEADRWTGDAAGVSPCGARARAGGAEGGPGRSAADLLVARWTGAAVGAGEGASDERWADGGAVGPEGGGVWLGLDWSAAARRWTGGCALVGALWAPGDVEGRFAGREGAASLPGAVGGVMRATAR
ncbi:hypothetical protein [Streptomyces sp. NPDC059402]|uniref:hypothetical protein n=1 Tax=Streptomyces sp. NPDC059402 TaxID=3346822 RepID=UPI0036C9A5C4